MTDKECLELLRLLHKCVTEYELGHDPSLAALAGDSVTLKMSTRELDLLRDAVDLAIEQENTGVESWDQAQSIESQRRQAQLMEIQKKLR